MTQVYDSFVLTQKKLKESQKYLHTHVYLNAIHSNQDNESLWQWMKTVWYIYRIMLDSAMQNRVTCKKLNGTGNH